MFFVFPVRKIKVLQVWSIYVLDMCRYTGQHYVKYVIVLHCIPSDACKCRRPWHCIWLFWPLNSQHSYLCETLINQSTMPFTCNFVTSRLSWFVISILCSSSIDTSFHDFLGLSHFPFFCNFLENTSTPVVLFCCCPPCAGVPAMQSCPPKSDF